jgi:hypothetical protein
MSTSLCPNLSTNAKPLYKSSHTNFSSSKLFSRALNQTHASPRMGPLWVSSGPCPPLSDSQPEVGEVSNIVDATWIAPRERHQNPVSFASRALNPIGDLCNIVDATWTASPERHQNPDFLLYKGTYTQIPVIPRYPLSSRALTPKYHLKPKYKYPLPRRNAVRDLGALGPAEAAAGGWRVRPRGRPGVPAGAPQAAPLVRKSAEDPGPAHLLGRLAALPVRPGLLY